MDIIINKEEWQIVLSDKSEQTHHCICGHNVKRITYIYNKLTKQILCIGTTCVKKYGIQEHMKNGILLLFIKNMIHTGNQCDETMLAVYIQDKYLSFREKIMTYSANDEIDYYDIVAPFRRLLDDVCDLVTEYKYDLTVLLKNIEKDVNSMNDHTKHIMIDESEIDIEAEAEGEAEGENHLEDLPEDRQIFEIISVEDISEVDDISQAISVVETDDDLSDNESYNYPSDSESNNDPSDNYQISDNDLSYNDPSDIEYDNDPSNIDLSYKYPSDNESESDKSTDNDNDNAESDKSTYYDNDNDNIESDKSIEPQIDYDIIITEESHNILLDNPEIIELDITPNLNICQKVNIDPICIGTSIYNINICCNVVSCYCDVKRRFYKLHTDIDQLKKDVADFTKKTADLSKNVREFNRIMI